MKLVIDPISGQLGVQVNPREYTDALYNEMSRECDNFLFSAGMFFFRTDADRLVFILKYDKQKKR